MIVSFGLKWYNKDYNTIGRVSVWSSANWTLKKEMPKP